MDARQVELLPTGYDALLKAIKERVRTAQVRAAVAVNTELVRLYWSIGNDILQKQQTEGWGSKVIDRLSHDLKASFPMMQGFSPRNLKYMRAFAAAWPDDAIVQRVVAQLPWRQNIALLDKLKDPELRLWYAQKAVENGWSQPVLVHQIETLLHERQGRAVTNFASTLPAPQSDLAQALLKDPYNFDFLTLAPDAQERHLEAGLLVHIREFLLELGQGFAFVGSQYELSIGDQDFRIDLLFYHLKLRCFIVIDLKMRAFEPEFAGKMNFYLSAVDDLLRHPSDAPSIGVVLCKTKNATIAEYALRDMNKPIGVSTHLTALLTRSLPEHLQSELPTIEELELRADAVPFPEEG
ncbi:MAG: PDDEXK nuclease domain-containing protein [Armatimonadetes bacterium]|nr:PDDEXK nuclease domain-containing protein [Armatimonadota bacterium]